MSSSLTLIVAATRTNGIGQGGRLPWRLPTEMAYFSRATKESPPEQPNAVIMGRNTWESIPKSRRPLAGRINVVITKNSAYHLGSNQGPLPSYQEPSLQAAITRINDPSFASCHRLFIIGGASVYREALALKKASPSSAIVDRILLTRILSPGFEECDVLFPEFRDTPGWTQAPHTELEAWLGFEVAEGEQEENGVQYEFQMWVRQA